jgi:hypothetical protein
MTTRTTKSVDTVVEWPDTIVSSDKTDTDLGPPLTQLLVDLGIKGTTADEATAGNASTAVKGLPVSVSIIEAGATAASKGWATLIAALGGGTAVWGAATNFWKSSSGSQGNLVIGAAIVIAACALGVALIMYGDVRARGQGAAAQYSARAAIATAFLQGATIAVKAQAAGANPPPNTPPPPPPPDSSATILTDVQATQKQVAGVSETAQQILTAAGTLSESLQEAIVALALAQSGNTDVPVVLKTGGSGSARKLIRSPQGEWEFQLVGPTWMPVSAIAAFGDEKIQPPPPVPGTAAGAGTAPATETAHATETASGAGAAATPDDEQPPPKK